MRYLKYLSLFLWLLIPLGIWQATPEKTSGQSLDLTAALQAAVVNSRENEIEQQKEEV